MVLATAKVVPVRLNPVPAVYVVSVSEAGIPSPTTSALVIANLLNEIAAVSLIARLETAPAAIFADVTELSAGVTLVNDAPFPEKLVAVTVHV